MNPANQPSIDVSGMSADEIESLMQQLLEQRIARTIEEKMTPLRSRYQALMTEITSEVMPFGLTAQKYLSMTRTQLERHMMTVMQNQAAANLPGGKKVAKVPPKFRNPNDPEQVWTGRGNRPIWVRKWLESGRTLEEILIQQPSKG